jgi:hypothetical protein
MTTCKAVQSPLKSGIRTSTVPVGHELANPVEALGEDPGAAVRLLVAVDVGQHGMVEPHRPDRLGDATRLVRIEQAGPACLDLAEATRACARVAHEQEGRRVAPPALADVGAHGLFAGSVQARATAGLEIAQRLHISSNVVHNYIN